MIESLIRNYSKDENVLPQIVVSLEKMNIDELISFYLGYSSSAYFIRYPNISKILNLMCNKIIEKLDTISTLKVIELFTDIYLETLGATERLEMHRNILKSDSYRIYTKNPGRELECVEESFKFIDKLNSKMFNYLDYKLKLLDGTERDEVIMYLNQKISENDDEIARRDEILHDENKISIISKYGGTDISKFKVRQNLDPTELKIKNEDVYKSLQAIVLENVIKK